MEGGGFPGLQRDFKNNTVFTSHFWSEDGDYVVGIAKSPTSVSTEMFVISAINGVEWRTTLPDNYVHIALHKLGLVAATSDAEFLFFVQE